ncbi:MAG: Leucine--tRNA ligase [Bacteroidetes bacterium ADurb.Bin090]|nr:MAG: Leucine--tRNA ligase [Bacteroidetes bacterium ADurb.Bin090]
MKCDKRGIIKPLIILLAPFAPHYSEEIWQALGEQGSVCDAAWPELNEDYLVEDQVTYAVSFNGKTRFMLELPAEAGREEVQKLALAHENSQKWLDGKTPKKIIVVPGKIVNIVV